MKKTEHDKTKAHFSPRIRVDALTKRSKIFLDHNSPRSKAAEMK